MTVGCGGDVAGEVVAQRLIRLRNSIDLLEMEFSRMASDFAKTDEYDQQGFDSPISWIKANCHMGGGAAGDRVCVGEQIERLGLSAVAVGLGEIGFAHLALIARTSAAMGERLNERRLLRKATELSVRRFRNACMHERHR